MRLQVQQKSKSKLHVPLKLQACQHPFTLTEVIKSPWQLWKINEYSDLKNVSLHAPIERKGQFWLELSYLHVSGYMGNCYC